MLNEFFSKNWELKLKLYKEKCKEEFDSYLIDKDWENHKDRLKIIEEKYNNLWQKLSSN